MGNAQDTALLTVEILEKILLSLDLKSILTSAQSVCHSWHDLISTSPSLQKHLYFQPDWNRKNKHRNPLLAPLFPGWFPLTDPQPGQALEEHGMLYSDFLGQRHDFESLALAQPDRNLFFMDKDASWRRMLIQQPPILDLAIFRARCNRGGTFLTGPHIQQLPQETNQDKKSVKDLYSLSLAGSNPLRMGLFFDEVVRTNGAIPRCWMILWDNENVQIPHGIHYYPFKEEEKQTLREILETYGMTMVVYQTQQCKRPFCWTPGEKFIFPQRDCGPAQYSEHSVSIR